MNLSSRKVRIGLFLTTAIGVAVGLWAAVTLGPIAGHTVQQAAGVLLIFSGLMLMSPFAVRRPLTEQTRPIRGRLSIQGAANIVYGVAVMLPSVTASLSLTVVALLMMAASWSGRLRRLLVLP